MRFSRYISDNLYGISQFSDYRVEMERFETLDPLLARQVLSQLSYTLTGNL